MSNDGGPAFPHQDSGDTGTRPGMTLRDYFAAKAMQAMLSGLVYNPAQSNFLCRTSYAMADAMLKARGEDA